MLLTLMADKMENYLQQPEIHNVYAGAISEFKNKEAITEKDFELMVAKFPRDQMQSQAVIINRILSECHMEFIPISQGENGGLDKLIQKIKDRLYYGFEITNFENIKSEAERLYRNASIVNKTIFQVGYNERCDQWSESVALKTKKFIDGYANEILDSLVEFLELSERVNFRVVRLKLSQEFKDSTLENDDLIVYKSEAVREYIAYSMLKNIFDKVILDPTCECVPMNTLEF